MPLSTVVRGYADAAAFAARVEPWLLRREAEHNLLLGLLPKLRSGDHASAQPIYLSAIETDDEVAGCAFRTPPFQLGLTRMPEEAVAPLVEHVGRVYAELPAVLGPEAEATRFAELWSRRTGCCHGLGMRQRIHALERVVFPGVAPAGRLRPAAPAEMSLVVEWLEGFARDSRAQAGDTRARALELMRDQALWLWDDGAPRSLVAASAWTPHGVRVGYVYTPPGFRGRGYATNAVASLSDHLLRAGRRVCFLYTDLANPTSNAIYARIGYRPVCDVVDVHFSAPG
jgi:hypothetical protein